jgi:DNA-binding NarL/FixJ family response regulator
MKGNSEILIVEDEQEARELLVRGLQRLGFSVTGVGDGIEACALLTRQFAVIVTDLLMPRMDGLALLKEIHQCSPMSRRIVITSFGDKDRVLAALNAGADYLLEKPFSAQQLANVIHSMRSDLSGAHDIASWFHQRLASFSLTERENDLVLLVLKGLGNKAIASNLGLGEQTVKNSLFALYQKLGIASRGELFHLVFPM